MSEVAELHPNGGAWDGERLALEALDLPAAVLDRDGRLCGATPRGERLLTRFGAELVGGAGPVPRELRAILDRAPDGEPVVWSPRQRQDDASLGCARHPLGRGHFLLVMRELTDKNRELSRRLHQQRLEVTGRLAHSIFHELREPLAAILFTSERLRGRMSELRASEITAAVADIIEAARRLRHVVEGLLGFARREPPSGRVSHLDELFDRVANLVRPVLRERGHCLWTFVGPGARRVRGNALLIEQILVNLLLNSAEAGEAPLEVRVTAGRDPGLPGVVRVRVSDDGPGIAAEVRAQVFEPFFSTKPGGTGLGLTSARESARELGGDLTLASSDGRGATFTLSLPAADEPAGAPASP